MRWLSLSLIAVVLVATIGLSWIFDVLYEEFTDTSAPQSQDAIGHAEVLTQQIALTLSRAEQPEEFIANWQQGNEYQLQKLALSELLLPGSLISELQHGLPLNLESDSDISIHVLIPDTDEVLILQIPVTPESETQFLDRYWITSIFYLLLILLFLLWVRPLITRLIKLRATARAFGKGDLTQRIPSGNASYIGDLEAEFNHMAQRIEDLISDVKLLSSAVSHDLRTPLARIRMGLDTLAEESDPQKRQNYEDRINDHIDEMVELIETLLSYARLDQAMLELEKRPVDVYAILQNIIQKKQIESKNLILQADPSNASFTVNGDSTYLKMLCNNLINNAQQHCHATVRIHLQHPPNKQDQNIVISISDDGPGIPPDLLEDIFKPFVRSRTSKHKGHGVGLAICKRVTDWHQGTISVTQSDSLKGAEFRVILPAD